MKSDSVFGVVFDMDGVLIDSASSHLESWRQLACELDSAVTEAGFHETFGRQNKDIIPILFGIRDPARIRELADRKEEIFRGLLRHRPPIVSGAVELIRTLSSLGARLAVGSSAPWSNVELALNVMGVSKLIHAVVSGDDIEKGKPDPQVFVEACGRLSLAPRDCVVIEDAILGIEAARRAGTRTVAIAIYHPASAFSGADLIVPRLADVRAEQLRSLVGDRRIDPSGPER